MGVESPGADISPKKLTFHLPWKTFCGPFLKKSSSYPSNFLMTFFSHLPLFSTKVCSCTYFFSNLPTNLSLRSFVHSLFISLFTCFLFIFKFRAPGPLSQNQAPGQHTLWPPLMALDDISPEFPIQLLAYFTAMESEIKKLQQLSKLQT